MSVEARAAKYIAAMEKTLSSTKRANTSLNVSQAVIEEIFGYVDAYLRDAKYFMAQGQYETSLVSIAYCEGLLDALKLMGAAKIEPNQSPQ
jgi:hypothetical protein